MSAPHGSTPAIAGAICLLSIPAYVNIAEIMHSPTRKLVFAIVPERVIRPAWRRSTAELPRCAESWSAAIPRQSAGANAGLLNAGFDEPYDDCPNMREFPSTLVSAARCNPAAIATTLYVV